MIGHRVFFFSFYFLLHQVLPFNVSWPSLLQCELFTIYGLIYEKKKIASIVIDGIANKVNRDEKEKNMKIALVIWTMKESSTSQLRTHKREKLLFVVLLMS